MPIAAAVAVVVAAVVAVAAAPAADATAPQLSLATRMEDWTSLGQHKRKPVTGTDTLVDPALNDQQSRK